MRRWGYKLQWSLQSGVKPASTTLPNEERRQQMLQMSSPGAAFETARQTVTLRIRLMRAAKIWSTWEHASLVRLQPHYVYILVNSKGAVTTALHAHSMRKRLVRLKKDRFTPPLPPCPPQVSFPFHIAPSPLHKIKYLCFLSLCLALISQGHALYLHHCAQALHLPTTFPNQSCIGVLTLLDGAQRERASSAP
jgi:hypothetical protein